MYHALRTGASRSIEQLISSFWLFVLAILRASSPIRWKYWNRIIINKCIRHPFSVLIYCANRCPTVSSIPNSFLHSLPPWWVMYNKIQNKRKICILVLVVVVAVCVVIYSSVCLGITRKSLPPSFVLVSSSKVRPEIGPRTNPRGMVGISIIVAFPWETSYPSWIESSSLLMSFVSVVFLCCVFRNFLSIQSCLFT